MRRGTIIWIGLLAMCIGGIVYEMPNAMLNLRYHRNTFVNVEDHVERVVSDKLIAADPEAGEILRYAIKRDAHYAGRRDLQLLVAEYPQNEFFLAELAEKLVESKNVDLQEMLAISDRLLAIDPNNAHYRYLRGWVLLKTPGGKQRVAEALDQFELGDRLPQFSLPYRRYKERVDRIAEQAALSEYDRPQIRTFYPDFVEIITGSPDWRNLDEQQLRRLIAAGSTMADRVIQNAYDIDSLYDGHRMMEKIEEIRLRRHGLSESQTRQAKARLDQARTIENLRWHWSDGLWLTYPSMADMMPLIIPVCLLFSFLRARSLLASPQDATKTTAGLAVIIGGVMLIALTLFMVLYGRHSSARWATWRLELPWLLFWFSWVSYSEALADIGSAKDASSRSIRSRPEIAYGLLWLNGTVLLLISNSSFLWSGSLAGWSRSVPVLAVWLAFCTLLWVSTYDRQPVFGRVPWRIAVIVTISGAASLLALDAFETRWHYESRAYAEPLSFCPPLPAAAQETDGATLLDTSDHRLQILLESSLKFG